MNIEKIKKLIQEAFEREQKEREKWYRFMNQDTMIERFW